MLYVCMLCYVEIMQDCTGSNYAQFQMLHTKTLEILGFEMLQKSLVSCFGSKNPVVELECEITRSETFLKMLLLISLNKKYDPIPITENSSFKIFGRVLS